MIASSREYKYYNFKLNETRNIVENTVLEYVQKYGNHCLKSEKIRCVAEFLDKIENEIKIINIERCDIFGELNKVMESSKSMIEFIRVDKLKIVIKRKIF